MYHIEKNTVQETLIIPLYGRKVCSEHFPDLFKDPESERERNLAFDLNDETWMDELRNWSGDFADVSAKSYMRGYRDIYKDVSFFHKLMIKFCDVLVKMQIIKVTFK